MVRKFGYKVYKVSDGLYAITAGGKVLARGTLQECKIIEAQLKAESEQMTEWANKTKK